MAGVFRKVSDDDFKLNCLEEDESDDPEEEDEYSRIKEIAKRRKELSPDLNEFLQENQL